MKIKVEVKNGILGDIVFWEGDSEDIGQIENVVAKSLAQKVAAFGGVQSNGMWVVSEVKEDFCPECFDGITTGKFCKECGRPLDREEK